MICIRRTFLLVLGIIPILLASCQTERLITRECDVLVIGGGTGGIAAGIQSARLGANTIVVEETTWLGGMLTAAGVGATDGNHQLPSGIWGEFRQKLYDYYGGPEAVATGWVSMTQFEPSVGNKILIEMADSESNLDRLHGFFLTEVLKNENTVIGAVFQSADSNQRLKVMAKMSIDATELGDAIGLSGADFRLGQDDKVTTGESWAPEKATDIIQDLTYVAILKYYNQDMTIAKPDGYDPLVFDCMCNALCKDGQGPLSCDKMLNYGEMPNGKFMINWPNDGNDYYTNAVNLNRKEREAKYEKAKMKTLAWIYHLQTEAGYSTLGIANDEFPTSDNLALIPYHREGRRLIGMDFITVDDLVDPYQNDSKPYYQTAIAVGDYPLDHHHDENQNAAKEEFPSIPSFSIPYGALVPIKMDGLLAAEKSISVSHLANGSTRLQPCVMVTGQAAGAAAALCVQKGINPRNLAIKDLQQTLLEADCWLLPFIDTNPQDWYFNSLQKMGVLGVIKGHGVPYKWANQTWIYPNTEIIPKVLNTALEEIGIESSIVSSDSLIRKEMAIQYLLDLAGQHKDYSNEEWWKNWPKDEGLDMDKPLLKKEMAYLIDHILQPFESNN